MADEIKKDWREEDVEKTKGFVEKWRKILFPPACVGFSLFVIAVIGLFFHVKTPFWVFGAFTACVLPWYATHTFKQVKAWENGVVFRFGELHISLHHLIRRFFRERFHPEFEEQKEKKEEQEEKKKVSKGRPLRRPGLRFILWPMDKIKFVKMYERKIDIPPQEVIVQEKIKVIVQEKTTQKDDVEEQKNPIVINVDPVFWFKVTDAVLSVTAIEDVEGALTQLFVATLREKCSGVSLQELIGNRDKIINDVRNEITGTLEGKIGENGGEKDKKENSKKEDGKKEDDQKDWGVRVTKLGLQDVRPPKEIIDALHGVFKADKARKEQIIGGEAEGQRRKKIADGEEYSIDKISDAQARRFDKFQKVDPQLGALALDTAGKIVPNKIILFGKDLGDAARNLGNLSPWYPKKPASSQLADS